MNQEDHIIDYLSGELEAEDQKAFENRLENDPDFAAEVEEYRQLYSDMEVFREHQALKNEVTEVADAVEAELRTQATPSRRRLPKAWAIAASLLLLATVTYFLLPKYSATYFQESYPGLIENPGGLRGDSIGEEVLANALKAYESQDYSTCINLINSRPVNSSERVLLGSALLLNDQAPEAISNLEPVLSDSSYLEYARWLLALAHLHEGEEAVARTYLEQIVSDTTRLYKRSEAESILAKLDSFWR